MDEEKNSVNYRFPSPPHRRSFFAPSAKSPQSSPSPDPWENHTRNFLALAAHPFQLRLAKRRRTKKLIRCAKLAMYRTNSLATST